MINVNLFTRLFLLSSFFIASGMKTFNQFKMTRNADGSKTFIRSSNKNERLYSLDQASFSESIDKDSNKVSLSNKNGKKRKTNNHVPIRVEMIHKAFDEIFKKNHSKDPYLVSVRNINELIGEYEYYEKPLDDLFKSVMKRLTYSSKEMENLDFYSNKFMEHLDELLSAKLLKFSMHEPFWYDLSRLVFKKMIRERERILDDGEFEKVLKDENLKSIISKIVENGGLAFPNGLDDSKLFSLTSHEFYIFETLMNCEVIENAKMVFGQFALVIKDFYIDHKGDENFICRDLKVDHFNGNPLLKFLIIKHVPFGELRKCLFDKSFVVFSSFHSNDHFKVSKVIMDSNYFEKLASDGPENFTISYMEYLSDSIIEFFLKRNKKFTIRAPYPHGLDILLGKLRTLMKSNSQKSLNEIIKFEGIDNELNKWNDVFIKYLKRKIK